MNVSTRILQMAKENNGIIKASDLVKNKISLGNVDHLLSTGQLEKVARGVYILPEAWEDEFVSLQSQLKRGVFSCKTALFLWGLTDVTPANFDMTFPGTYNLTNAKKMGINCSSVKTEWYNKGKTFIKSPGNNVVAAYSMERTLCDILRRKDIDKGIISMAFKEYVNRKDKNIPKLSEYAKTFHVEKKVRNYLEVLL